MNGWRLADKAWQVCHTSMSLSAEGKSSRHQHDATMSSPNLVETSIYIFHSATKLYVELTNFCKELAASLVINLALTFATALTPVCSCSDPALAPV